MFRKLKMTRLPWVHFKEIWEMFLKYIFRKVTCWIERGAIYVGSGEWGIIGEIGRILLVEYSIDTRPYVNHEGHDGQSTFKYDNLPVLKECSC